MNGADGSRSARLTDSRNLTTGASHLKSRCALSSETPAAAGDARPSPACPSGLFQWGGCRHQTSVTAGTIFQEIRKLSGVIEVDETFVGGEETAVHGRQIETKALVVIAAQADHDGIGRIRMRRIPDASSESLLSLVHDVIDSVSTVHTDGWSGYAGLSSNGYKHEVKVLRGKPKSAETELLPRVHRVAGLLKRWLLGNHQGAVAGDYLDYYLDEFTFRFNRRTSKSRGMLFCRLVQQAGAIDPVPYQDIMAPEKPHP